MALTSAPILETPQPSVEVGGHLHFYTKGETIPLMSAGIWQICQGLVRLSTFYPSGEEGLLGWIGPSMCFSPGFCNLESYEVTAISDVCLMWYSNEEIEASATLAQELLPQLGRRFRQTEALLAIAGLRRVEDRLQQLLLLLKQEFGQPTEGGTRLSIRLTHQDIAGAINTTRVTITRMLGKLQQQGLIARDKHRHLIIAKDAFVNSSNLYSEREGIALLILILILILLLKKRVFSSSQKNAVSYRVEYMRVCATIKKALIPETLSMKNSSPHRGWNLNEEEREVYRRRSRASNLAKKQALSGNGMKPIHPINFPKLNPDKLMPQLPRNGWRSLSLFSGCGGLDLGFDRAGFTHVAAYDLLAEAGITLKKLRPHWQIFSGDRGDVKKVDWRPYRGLVDLIHAGPPCQPFSTAGRQKGKEDNRDMFPEFVRAVLEIEPLGFIAENVVALGSKKFGEYVKEVIESPLEKKYKLTRFILTASDFGVPQIRKRIFFVGFRDEKVMVKYRQPLPTHYWHHLPTNKSSKPVQLNLFDNFNSPKKLQRCMGVREALGLSDIEFDALSPTIRSALTGPRHTTSILSSVSAQKAWEKLQIWPNGVAENREKARLFVAKNGHFRLSVADCGILQGFPEEWEISGAVYLALGQIGNAVPPPMAYRIAESIAVLL